MAARPITMTWINKTDVELLITNFNHQHGTQPVVQSGPNPIPVGGQAAVYAENTGMVGPQGNYTLTFQDGSGRAFNVSYNHPYGTGETYVNVQPPDGYSYSMTQNHLAHHDAYCTIELLKLA
ncbi:MAG: hypothetical protein H6824_00375 [Planctomycetaceae bacterium]|nr:hypothetical protein [Planctomycetaceae bacterium]